MKKPVAGLIDYDMGNLRSVAKALEKAGCRVRRIEKASQIKGIDAMVLPGVGSFHVAVRNLKSRKLFTPIQAWIRSDKPFLGICLGYQLLFEEGKEGGRKESGLGIFKGKVQKFSAIKNLKVPHMGWNQVQRKKNKLFNGISEDAFFYFVHSYFPVPSDSGLTAGTTNYGKNFSSCILWNRSFACQFHPEKSGENGLRLLKNFTNGLKPC